MKNWQRSLLIGGLVALASQLYWNVFVNGFRISTSVILLPVLLMTLGRNLHTIHTCTLTGCIVFLFRLTLMALRYVPVPTAPLQFLPNAVFYLCYGIIFHLIVKNKHTVPYNKLIFAIFCSDFLSNMVEILLQDSISGGVFTFTIMGYLLLIAVFRTLLAGLFLLAESQYRILLTKEEHENRYQRLFLMTTGLKNEVYFMRKNSEEIESVMSNAYRLYEKLSELEVPGEMKQMSLAIARDVHEIKKDYIRIIQGIEEEISEEYDEKRMSFQDLLQILEETTYHIIEAKELPVRLEFQCSDNFITQEHYELMAVLKNIVNNAIEAIASDVGKGTVRIEENLEDGIYIFRISDNGPGISPKHLPNIFKMGYSTKFDYKTGNIFRGVGLYGVKATVEEKFKGTIEVESTAGHGAVFTIRIPASSLEEA